METEQLPWLFAIITAGWFGWMAQRADRARALWAVGGGAFGLVASTLVIGLGRASELPYSEHQAQMDRLKWTALAALLIFGVGWLLTGGLHQHWLLLERQAKTTPTTPPAPTETKSASPPQPKGPARTGA